MAHAQRGGKSGGTVTFIEQTPAAWSKKPGLRRQLRNPGE